MYAYEVQETIDNYGPHRWVTALRSNHYVHHAGWLGTWPQFGTEVPPSACCLGVLAMACGIASNQPDKPERGRPKVTIGWEYQDEDDGGATQVNDDTEFSYDYRPWWLDMQLTNAQRGELRTWHPRFFDGSMAGPYNMQAALILINDWDGGGDGSEVNTTATKDYTWQIKFIEQFIIPEYDRRMAKRNQAPTAPLEGVS